MVYWDTLTGFGLRISQGGSKSFIVVYGVNRKKNTIGRYPIISLSEARIEAKRILAEHVLGKHKYDPISYEDALERYLAQCGDKNSLNTVADYKRMLNSFKFRKTLLSDITQYEVFSRIEGLRGHPYAQNYHFSTIATFFRWAVIHQLLERSPIEGIPKPNKVLSRDHVLTVDELKAVYQHALGYEHLYGNVVALCLLTGQRKGEIASLQWDWIDSKEKTITLPAKAVKSSRLHTFPYGKLTTKILKTIPQDSEFLFPASRQMSERTTVFNGWSKAKKAFDKDLEGVNPWRLHDLRRSFATVLASKDTNIHVIERLLNHVTGSVSGVAGIYNRYSYLDEMRVAIASYEKVLSSTTPIG